MSHANFEHGNAATKLPLRQPTVRRVTTSSGATAEVVKEDDKEKICVRDKRGQLLFSYDADSGLGTLTIPDGDLRVAAPRGNIDLLAGKRIRLAAVEDIDISSHSSVQLQCRQQGAKASRMLLTNGRIDTRSERLSMSAKRADLSFSSTRYVSETLLATVEHAELVLGKLDTIAQRVRQRSKELFQQVQGLHQVRAGRFRAIVEDSLDMRGRSTTIEADEDVRINGNKINLG